MSMSASELELLRQSNTQLRMEQIQLRAELKRLTVQSAEWQQIALAAIAKAEQLEQRKFS